MFHFVYILMFNYLTLYKVHIYAGTKGKLVYAFVSVREIIHMLKVIQNDRGHSQTLIISYTNSCNKQEVFIFALVEKVAF